VATAPGIGRAPDVAARYFPWHRVVTAAIFLVASALLVLPGALGEPRVSVYDETTHADWIVALLDADPVRRADTLDPTVLAEWSCRGWYYDSPLPPCASVPNDPSAYPASGLNYNYFHPPVYYLLTAAGVAAVRVVAPDTDVITAARLMGVAWAAAAMAGVYVVARELGARRSVARAAGVLTLTFPLVTHLFSVVNNDPAVVVVGALVTWVGLRAVRTGVPWWWAIAAGAVAAATKVVAFPAVLAAIGFVVTVAMVWQPDGPRRRQLLGVAALLMVGFVATTALWLGIQTLRAPDVAYVDPVPGDVTGADVPAALVRSALDLVPPTAGGRSPVELGSSAAAVVKLWTRLGNHVIGAVPLALVFAGAGAAAAQRRRLRATPGASGAVKAGVDPWWLGVPLGASILAGLVAGAVALNVQHWLAKGSALSALHARYGLALLAALVGGLSMLVDRHRAGRVGLWVLTGLGVVVTVATSL
jgi:hypothetical protein